MLQNDHNHQPSTQTSKDHTSCSYNFFLMWYDGRITAEFILGYAWYISPCLMMKPKTLIGPKSSTCDGKRPFVCLLTPSFLLLSVPSSCSFKLHSCLIKADILANPPCLSSLFVLVEILSSKLASCEVPQNSGSSLDRLNAFQVFQYSPNTTWINHKLTCHKGQKVTIGYRFSQLHRSV